MRHPCLFSYNNLMEMAANSQYQIDVKLQDNTVTVNDLDDKIFVVQSQGTADLDRLVDEIKEINSGLEQEIVRMVLALCNRAIVKLILSGYRLNTGLFILELVCKGVTYDKAWHPGVNSLQIRLRLTKELREALNNTTINIVGESTSAMSVTGAESALGVGYRVKAGRAFTLYGKNIKVVGNALSVGITLTNSENVVTKIEADLIVQNSPKKLIFIIPEGIADGEYELKIVTQYSSSSRLLKKPRAVVKSLTVCG